MLTKVVPASALFLLLACGSSSDTTSPGGSSGAGCTLTVSGATTGSYGCTSRSASSSDTTGLGYVMMGYGIVGQTIPVIGVSFTFPDVPMPGTFTDADVDAGTTARISVTAGDDAWAAIDGTPALATGTYTLVLTRATPTKVAAEGVVYAVSGSLDATLPPVPSTAATGNVTLHATF